jgi:hypothetical protein
MCRPVARSPWPIVQGSIRLVTSRLRDVTTRTHASFVAPPALLLKRNDFGRHSQALAISLNDQRSNVARFAMQSGKDRAARLQ